MPERDYYNHEQLFPGSPWRIVDAKLPVRDIEFNKEDPNTYQRMIFNPFTNEHKLILASEIEERRRILKEKLTRGVEEVWHGDDREIS